MNGQRTELKQNGAGLEQGTETRRVEAGLRAAEDQKETADLHASDGGKTAGSGRRCVDIVIPVYRPREKFLRLMQMLAAQTYPIGKIILMNTEKALWTDEAEQLCRDISDAQNAVGTIEVHHIIKQEFDHAATRRTGVSCSAADAFICMTDDAVPADAFLVERLMRALYLDEICAGYGGEASGSAKMQSESCCSCSGKGTELAETQLSGMAARPGEPTVSGSHMQADRTALPIAEAYARQLPDETCGEAERFTRGFNYPAVSVIKGKQDLPRLGIKTYFASNVCCAYRRDVYDALGGFCEEAIFNEDMIFAAKAVQAGYGIAYCADAAVVHAHRYTAMQQLHRNFDLGMSQSMHPEVFSGLRSEGEGIRLVKETAAHLWRVGFWRQIPGLIVQSGFKYLGFRLGRAYRKLPYGLCLQLAMNKEYLRRHRKGIEL